MIIDFSNLKSEIQSRGFVISKTCKILDLSSSYINSVQFGTIIPRADVLVKICAFTKIPIDDAVKFDVTVKDEYKSYSTTPPAGPVLTYEPLRQMIGNGDKEKLFEFLDSVNNVYGEQGLNLRMKRAIYYDRPVSMKVIYSICSVLGCTPGMVFTGKAE